MDNDAPLAELDRLTQELARAEARQWAAMLAAQDAQIAQAEALEHPLRRQLERAVGVLEIARVTGLSEAQAQHRLASARHVRDEAPQTWLAFLDGRVDAARVREISSTVDVLEREESVLRLDQSVVAYASAHTTAELRRWLRRFVARVEADLALERAEEARTRRHVRVSHAEDSMSWLSAYLPSHVAAAIGKRLAREAKALGADDPRTLPQREADLLAAWLTTSESSETHLVSDIAVTLEAETLTGRTDGFATSSDGAWTVPARWAMEEALTGDALWHRLLIDPVTGDTLSHQYVGRFAPERLAKAVAFRDGVCQAPGCLVPADRCDLDHREPWPAGSTSGENIWPLCRRHHVLKGHRLIGWVMPSGRNEPAQRVEHGPPSAEASSLEHRLATFLVQHEP